MPEAAVTIKNTSSAQAEAYLDLLAGCLSRTMIPEFYQPIEQPTKPIYRWLYPVMKRALGRKHIALVRHYDMEPETRLAGQDWPPDAETMIGLKRLENLRSCIRTVIDEDISGDFIETGVWRGGACIFMRGALNAYGDQFRTVWLADSFQGLPKPNAEKYAADQGDRHWTHSDYLGVSVDKVKSNFARYHLLDDRVRFLKGWFSETLPTAPIQRISILRLDGDMYESTMDAISALYPKLAPGGFAIVDDYGLKACKAAIHDYRDANGITEHIVDIDGTGSYWRRAS